MKTIKRLCFWAVLLLAFGACSSNDDEVGDWEKTYLTFPGKGRTGAASFMMNNKAYVGLGLTADGDEMNDFWEISGGRWRELAPFPGGARYGAVAFSDGKYGYVGLGYAAYTNLQDKDQTWFSDFWKYDPEANSWSQIANFPGKVRRFGVAFYLDAKGYVGTGEGQDKEGCFSDIWSYDPATDSWNNDPSYVGDPRKGAVAWVIGKSAYLATGVYGTSDYTTDVHRFTPSNAGHEWESLDALKNYSGQGFDNDYPKIPRAFAVMFVVGNDADQSARAYLATGSRGSALTDCWEFDPYDRDGKGSWDEVTSFPSGALREQAVAFVLDGFGYVTLGGTSSGTSTKQSTYKFYPGIEDDDENDN